MSKIGIVKHWNEERGFGHIGQEGNPQDIFVHRTCLIGCTALKLNDRVMYEAIYDDRKNKFQAISVRPIPVDPGMPPVGAPAPGMPPHGASPGHFPHHPAHPNPYQQPMPVHNHFQSSPSQMTPLSSPGTPPIPGGYVPPMHQQGSQNFVPHAGSQRFTFNRQGTTNSMMGGSPGHFQPAPGPVMGGSPGHFVHHQNPSGPPPMSPNQVYPGHM